MKETMVQRLRSWSRASILIQTNRPRNKNNESWSDPIIREMSLVIGNPYNSRATKCTTKIPCLLQTRKYTRCTDKTLYIREVAVVTPGLDHRSPRGSHTIPKIRRIEPIVGREKEGRTRDRTRDSLVLGSRRAHCHYITQPVSGGIINSNTTLQRNLNSSIYVWFTTRRPKKMRIIPGAIGEVDIPGCIDW